MHMAPRAAAWVAWAVWICNSIASDKRPRRSNWVCGAFFLGGAIESSMQKGPAPGVQAKLAAAVRHHQAGQLIEAERLYRQVLQAAPCHADALHFLGLLVHQTGRHDLAVQLIDQAIAQNGRVPAFHHNRGVVLSGQAKHTEAVSSYRRAIDLNPQFVEAHLNLGAGLQALSCWDEAANSYACVIALKPEFAEAHANLGIIRVEQGRPDDALKLYERALQLKPSYVEAHNGLGNALRQQGNVDAAMACYRRALELKPDFVEAHDNIGILLLQRGLPDEALSHFDRALAYRPDHASAHSHRGNALKELGESARADESYRRALVLAPDDPDARLGLAIATIPVVADSPSASSEVLGRFTHALDDLVAWSSAHPGMLGNSVGTNLPFYLAYRTANVGAALSKFGDLICAAAGRRWPVAAVIGSASRSAHEKVHLVVVSGHVCRHPVWDVVLRGVLANLDRRRIDITLYHTGSTTDEETVWAKDQVDRWVQGPKSLPGWLDEVARDLPDVLFYPEVGMDPITWALAALRLAPVQIAGWGHPVTTGLPTMDLFVSGERLDGVEASAHYREKLVRLPGTGVCTTMALGPSMRWEGPGRPPGSVRFALCQQPMKFDPADDVLLARIAKAVGPSEFWLAAPDKLMQASDRLHKRLAAVFRAEGLDPQRHLRVMPWLPREQFLGFLDEMDIYLDCPAFSGYTTAWQALHRGLPIVTCEGPYLRQRLAAGLMREIGLTEGIVGSRDHYVEQAVRWAEECRLNPYAWTARRADIRRAAPLADGNREAVSAFERVLVECVWRQSADHRPRLPRP
jgi:protein O-GlcNAc transferase